MVIKLEIRRILCNVKISPKKEVTVLPYYRRIRKLREDHDLTQRQLADILGMRQPQYFRYEQGYRDLPTDVLIRLADLYQKSADYILGRTDNPAPPAR